jgi:excisionase family DNA binding protein
MATLTGSPLLTVPDVAAALRVDRGTVYRLIRSGRLPHVRFGTGDDAQRQIVRVRAADLERFIADREADSCPAR